jgi:NADH:ubiquinone oxidoreductase subunit F (NADH-binding)
VGHAHRAPRQDLDVVVGHLATVRSSLDTPSCEVCSDGSSMDTEHSGEIGECPSCLVVVDESVDFAKILQRIAGFFRDESCGQCVPCRVGTVRQEEALCRITSGKTIGGVPQEVALLDEIGLAMKDASICGLGQTAYAAIESAIHRVGVFKGRMQ